MTERLPRPMRPRLRPPVAVMGLVLAACAALAWWSREDYAYWLQRPEPVDLGRLGEYRLERLADNTYARIKGALGPAASRAGLVGPPREIRIIVSTNVFVERPRSKDPSPLVSYEGAGRLVRASTSRAYQPVAEFFRQRGYVSEGREVWILQDGERPRQGLGVPVSAALLVTLAALNGYGLVRALAEHLSRKAE